MTDQQATLPAVSEDEFLDQVNDLADMLGWMHYHTHDSRRSTPGFPDLVLVHPTRPELGIVFLELKSAKGRTTPAQARWVMALRRSGSAGQVWSQVVKPDQLTEVARILNGTSSR